MRQKNEYEEVNMHGSPQGRQTSQEQMPYPHSGKQQWNLLCLETKACFNVEQCSQTDRVVVEGVATGNNRFWVKQPLILHFSEDHVIVWWPHRKSKFTSSQKAALQGHWFIQTITTTVLMIALKMVEEVQIRWMVVINYRVNLDPGIKQNYYQRHVTEDVNNLVADPALSSKLD